MKKILFASLMICSFVCKGQKLPDTDTIRVIIQVSDTVEYKNYTTSAPNRNYFDKANWVIWVMGYSVRKRYNHNQESNGDWQCFNCEDYMRHSYYLDADRKPLSKNIVVWMSKEINKQ